MAYLHGRHYFDEQDNEWKDCILHRDLKPDNCLVTEFLSAKIADFGTSRARSGGRRDGNSSATGGGSGGSGGGGAANDHALESGEGFEFDEGDSMTMTAVGTPVYCAPEISRGEQYDEAVDVYSFGMTLLTMCVNKGDLGNFLANRYREAFGLKRSPRQLMRVMRPIIDGTWRPLTTTAAAAVATAAAAAAAAAAANASPPPPPPSPPLTAVPTPTSTTETATVTNTSTSSSSTTPSAPPPAGGASSDGAAVGASTGVLAGGLEQAARLLPPPAEWAGAVPVGVIELIVKCLAHDPKVKETLLLASVLSLVSALKLFLFCTRFHTFILIAPFLSHAYTDQFVNLYPISNPKPRTPPNPK
jgi:serine/threonine protein kinase